MEVDNAHAFSEPAEDAPAVAPTEAEPNPQLARNAQTAPNPQSAPPPQPTIEQIRALVVAKFPAFATAACPAVALGARWQLDLRTGERLEEQPVVVPFPVGSSAALAAAAQQASGATCCVISGFQEGMHMHETKYSGTGDDYSMHVYI